jgi:putative RNA 2'-phosphotransferase
LSTLLIRAQPFFGDPRHLRCHLLSKHLRHRPERLGLELGPGGWVEVDALLEACARQRFPISRAELEEVVERNDKKRFAFDPSGSLIRAQQGHSVPVDLLLESVEPPPELYHGTPERNLEVILRQGLHSMGHHHVHLSPASASRRPCIPSAWASTSKPTRAGFLTRK